MSLKKIQEQRGAKVKELDAIFATARTENRTLSADEGTKYDAIEAEVRAFDVHLEREVRHAATLSAQPQQLTIREERDVNKFDLGKALRSLAKETALDGIEAEIVAEGRNEASVAGIASAGITLPRFFVRRQAGEQRAVSATGQTTVAGDQGGMTVATTKAGLVDDFYNASAMREAGATVMEGLVGNLDLPRLTAGSAPVKKTENATAGDVSPLTAMLSLSAKRLPAFVDIGEQLLRQSSSAIEVVIRKAVSSGMLAVQEAAFFHGGGTNEANGIAGTTGIGSVAGGTNGLPPTYANLIALETAVDTQNARLGNLRYASNGQIRGKLKSVLKNPSGTDSGFILGESNMVNGYQPVFTNAISRTLVKGSSGSVASAIFFGNFADYVIAYWGGLTLELLRDSANAKVGQYTLVASTYYDGGVWRPKSFAATLDALGA